MTQSAHTGPAAGNNFVGVSLMADIPNNAISRRVEDVMQRCGQLHHAQAGAKMPPGDRDDVDQVCAQFIGELAQILFG